LQVQRQSFDMIVADRAGPGECEAAFVRLRSRRKDCVACRRDIQDIPGHADRIPAVDEHRNPAADDLEHVVARQAVDGQRFGIVIKRHSAAMHSRVHIRRPGRHVHRHVVTFTGGVDHQRVLAAVLGDDHAQRRRHTRIMNQRSDRVVGHHARGRRGRRHYRHVVPAGRPDRQFLPRGIGVDRLDAAVDHRAKGILDDRPGFQVDEHGPGARTREIQHIAGARIAALRNQAIKRMVPRHVELVVAVMAQQIQLGDAWRVKQDRGEDPAALLRAEELHIPVGPYMETIVRRRAVDLQAIRANRIGIRKRHRAKSAQAQVLDAQPQRAAAQLARSNRAGIRLAARR